MPKPVKFYGWAEVSLGKPAVSTLTAFDGTPYWAILARKPSWNGAVRVEIREVRPRASMKKGGGRG